MLITTEDLLLFIYIYLFCFLGAFSKDMLDIFLNKIPKVLIFKVLTSSLAVTILVYGLSDYLVGKLSYRPFTAICFISGIISFEFMTKYNSMQNIGSLIDAVYKIKHGKNKDKG